jgi:hypothetical protein
MKRREAALDLYTAVLGAFLFISPWLFAYREGFARDDAFLSGAVLLAVSLLAIAAFKEWEEWVNLAIGLWLIAAPFVLGFPHHAPGMHIAVSVGGVVTFLSLLELWLIRNPGWTEHATPLQQHDPEPRTPAPRNPLNSP